jgi:YesN/AraC family two-component response regulator
LQMDSSNAVLVKTEIETRNNIEANESKNSLPILLVIDDNPEIRKVLSSIFSSTFQVLEAADGEKGLKIAQKEIPDCIISDIMMPGMDGLLFTKLLKENELTSFIPIILLTAKTSDEAHLDALKSTADSFLTKPFNHAILKETVNQLIQERKKLQQRYSKELILKPLDIVINSIDERFLDKLQQLINEQISNPEFSAEEFADKMGMGKMQLYRKLKSLIGLSATEYLRSERLKVAASLLKKGTGNISEIAYSVGFNDLSYFSKCFKEVYHCSPSEFTKREAEE